ncbi:hypothetical protein IK146_00870 [Candidatus Saccharibacteria bacterium]|nr:hypothetical protein [Candidatus Saccharibacteria bacterium]
MEKKTTRKSVWIVLILLIISLLGGYFLTSYLANKKNEDTKDDPDSIDIHQKDLYYESKKFDSPVIDEESEVVDHEETEGEGAINLDLHSQSSEANQDHTSHDVTRSK